MKDIEQQLDRLAEKLPKGYEVRIAVEQGSAWLDVMTPALKRVPFDGDSETCWAMLMSEALAFCLNDAEENVNLIHTK